MRSRSTAEFSKQKSCPSADQLLLYCRRVLVGDIRFLISAHLAACDFCHAEMHLLMNHAPASECGAARV